MIVRDAINAVLSALLAPPCAACGRPLDTPLDGAVCARCWDAIAPRVLRYSMPCIARAAAIGVHEGTLRDVLHAFKYDGRRSIAPRLGAMIARECGVVITGADAAVPVPLHRRRHRERGFNQAEELARHVGLPVWRVLTRVRPTRPQVDLPAGARRENVRGAFTISRRWPFGGSYGGSVRGHTLVLVDDVSTTGATLESCARVLKAAGAKEIRAVTAARVVTGSRR